MSNTMDLVIGVDEYIIAEEGAAMGKMTTSIRTG
jgi:hypothetical protein